MVGKYAFKWVLSERGNLYSAFAWAPVVLDWKYIVPTPLEYCVNGFHIPYPPKWGTLEDALTYWRTKGARLAVVQIMDDSDALPERDSKIVVRSIKYVKVLRPGGAHPEILRALIQEAYDEYGRDNFIYPND